MSPILMINAPGFAPAWENAKSQAAAEVSDEDKGNTLPKRIFRKFFGAKEVDAIEMDAETETAPKEEATS